MTTNIPNVGSQDLELPNSPVADEADDDLDVLRQEMPGEPACYFNGTLYEQDSFVLSGGVVLRCDYGLWVPAGPGDPDNP